MNNIVPFRPIIQIILIASILFTLHIRSMATPEQKARELIDAQLATAGWIVQDRDEMSLGAGLGVAVREYPLATGPCDYLLFVDRKACGVVEAKPEGVTLSGVADQASRYQHQLPGHLAAWGDPLRFDYEASASEILFSDRQNADQRSRYPVRLPPAGNAPRVAYKRFLATCPPDIPPLLNYREPDKVTLVGSIVPRTISNEEGAKIIQTVESYERDSSLAREKKAENLARNGGVVVCEACGFSDPHEGMFDAHHLVPLCVGHRVTTLSDLAVLVRCATAGLIEKAKGH